MEAAFLRQLVTVESAPEPRPHSLPLRPQPSLTKSYPAIPQTDSDSTTIELMRFFNQATQNGRGKATSTTVTSADAPGHDLEMSRPASPLEAAPNVGVEAMQSIWDPYMNRFRLLCACLMSLVNGASDAAAGPMLPYMEKYYNVGYAVVSLIFVGQAIGFLTGAALIEPLRERLGWAKTLALSQIFMMTAYIIITCTAPFPAIVVAYFFIGLGISVNLALCNIFCGSLLNSATALGAMHGSYGLGGIAGPLVANAFVSALHMVWSRYYLITLGLCMLNMVMALWAYRHFIDDHHHVAETVLPTSSGSLTTKSAKLRTILGALTSRIVLLASLFIFAYQGAEVSISGWVISFLEEERGGDPSRVGYVSSGFWAGITLGRFLLSVPAQKIGEKLFVYGLVAGAAGFELLVWFVPNVIGDAVAVAVVGLLLGPVYPCAAAIFMRTMSRTEKLRGMGLISAFGSSGGAAAPFTTGLLAQGFGTWVLHPIAIGLFAVMLGVWFTMPSGKKRKA